MPNPFKLITEESTRWAMLREELEKLDDMDERTLLDTLEGETDLLEAINQIDWFVLQCEAEVAGASHVLTRLIDRRDRAEMRGEKLRTIIARTMEKAGLKKAKTAAGTYSLRDLAPGVVVEDETQIPPEFFREQAPKLDKKALNDAVKAGRIVPGIRMSNGSTSLSVRRV